MRILALHAGMHDASAAAFDDYALVAAASEERFTRQKGYGQSVPWLAIDEVLRIAGWRRNEVDAIALTRHAAELGFAGALVLPPFYYKGVPDDGLVAYIDAILQSTAAKPVCSEAISPPPRRSAKEPTIAGIGQVASPSVGCQRWIAGLSASTK